jgi:hypothetical protein
MAIPPTPFPLQNSFQSPPTGIGTEALQRRPPARIESLVSPRTATGTQNIISFGRPRNTYEIGLFFLSFLLPFSVSFALFTADLFPMVASPVLPIPPFSRLVAAIFAAVTL